MAPRSYDGESLRYFSIALSRRLHGFVAIWSWRTRNNPITARREKCRGPKALNAYSSNKPKLGAQFPNQLMASLVTLAFS